MALKQMINRIGYGVDDPLPLLAPAAIKLTNAPLTTDHAEFGQIAITPTNAYIAGLTTANSTLWFQVGGGGGAGSFASLTVTPGPTSITGTTGINTSGSGVTTINTGGTGVLNLGNATGGTVVTGPLSSGNDTITGNLSQSGGTVSLVSTGTSTYNSGTGAFSISTDAAATTLNIGTGAAAKAVTLGSLTTTSATTINSGSGGANVASSGIIDISSSNSGSGAVTLAATNAAGGILLSAGATLGPTAGINLLQGANGASIQVGSGTPSHAAAQGTLFLNHAGSGVADRLFVNTDGSTGWTNFVSAA